MSLPAFCLRPADEADFPAIQSLIHEVHINPLGLDWRRFLLAVEAGPQGAERMIGCGQVKPHEEGTQELASIAVIPECRGQGVATAIICRLINEHPGPLYLTCRASLGEFYVRFGFQRLAPDEQTPYYRRITRLTGWLNRLKLVDEAVLVMLRDDRRPATDDLPPPAYKSTREVY